MSKIISLIIKFLNSINKFIWKIIIFLSKFIKIDELNDVSNMPNKWIKLLNIGYKYSDIYA